MSITMGQLASNLLLSAGRMNPVMDAKLRTLAQLGVGHMKSEIQAVHAVDTGTMLNSTQAERQGTSYLIGPSVNYAPYVALGTSRMPARPFHISAASKLQRDIPTVMAATAVDLGL